MSSRQATLKLKRKTKSLPINLARKFERERRIKNSGVGKNRKYNQKKRLLKQKHAKDFESTELDALVKATELQLKDILENEEILSDIPFDITPDELHGEISLAQGGGTTIYVQRDGLSTLTVQLPQEQPTIAQLKRAIAAQARVQLKRELRERHEERIRRRQQQNVLQTKETIRGNGDNNSASNNKESQEQEQPQQDVKRRTTTCKSNVEYSKSVRLTGELVCSTTHNGHQHRPNVSWRFLWRSYALFNLATKSLVNDDENDGRKLLSECGIENAQTLKFTKRQKYLGKKRQ